MNNEFLNRVQKANFHKILLEERTVASFYKSMENRLNGDTLFTDSSVQQELDRKSVYEIGDFPGYLSARVDTDLGWRLKTVNTFNGSCIYLGNYTSAKKYFEVRFSPKRRSKLRTYQRRLDRAFDIRYQNYYGNITKEEYRFILNELKELVIRRFKQVNRVHDDLHLWDHYYDIAYQLILKKQAVLFVIYDGKKPISIALNLIHGNLMFPYIRGFDTDYSKFYPGYIDFSEQIRWAFDQNIQVFDLLKGAYPYKDRLKDHVYFFQKQILYNTEGRFSRLRANALFFINRLFYAVYHFTKTIGVYSLYHRLRESADPNKKRVIGTSKFYKIDKLVDMPPPEELILVDKVSESFDVLRRPIYDFLYSAEEQLSAIEVFRVRSRPDSFIISGQSQHQQITFKTPPQKP